MGKDVRENALKERSTSRRNKARNYASALEKIHYKYDLVYTGLSAEQITEVNTVPIDNVPNDQLAAANDWQKLHKNIPEGFADLNPRKVKGATFTAVQLMLAGEGQVGVEANRSAFETAHIFRSVDRVLSYLERWGEPVKQPLSKLVEDIKAPPSQAFINVKEWGDAIIQNGPCMAKLFRFAHKVSTPAQSKDYKHYGYKATQAEVLDNAYENSFKNPTLARLCKSLILPEEIFETALEIVDAYKNKVEGFFPQKDLPDVKIKGVDFGLDGYRFRKLSDGDIRALFIGNLTDCCQHVAHEKGGLSAKHGYLSDEGGVYVVEDKEGDVVAHSWAWRGQDGELVLDSLETKGNRVTGDNWQKLCSQFAKALDQNQNRHNVQKLNVGTGGRTPKLSFNQASSAASPKDFDGYRSSTQQYQIWQRN